MKRLRHRLGRWLLRDLPVHVKASDQVFVTVAPMDAEAIIRRVRKHRPRGDAA